MKTRVVAKVLVARANDEVLLLRRSETDSRRPLQWDIPGGHTDKNESAEEAAVRETHEEAGLDLEVRDLQLVYAISAAVEHDLNVVWLFFVARTDTTVITLSSEHCEYQWVPLATALTMIDYERQREALEYIHARALLPRVHP